MFGFLRSKPNERELEVIDRIKAARKAGFKSMRVEKDGTLVIDASEAVRSDCFKSKARLAGNIVRNT